MVSSVWRRVLLMTFLVLLGASCSEGQSYSWVMKPAKTLQTQSFADSNSLDNHEYYRQRYSRVGYVTPAPEIPKEVTESPSLSPSFSLLSSPVVKYGYTAVTRLAKWLSASRAVRSLVQKSLESYMERSFGPAWLTTLKQMVVIGEKLSLLAAMKDNQGRSSSSSQQLLHAGMTQLRALRDNEVDTGELKNATLNRTLRRGVEVLSRLLGVTNADSRSSGRGYGGGGSYPSYGGSYQSSYGSIGGFDPLTLLAGLAFLAYLIQALMTLLMRSTTSSRSLDVTDALLPLQMSDMPDLVSSVTGGIDKYDVMNSERIQKRSALSLDEDEYEEGALSSLVSRVENYYSLYRQAKQNPHCVRNLLCRLATEELDEDVDDTAPMQLTMVGMGHLAGDKGVVDFIERVKRSVEDKKEVDCDALAAQCSTVNKSSDADQ